MVVDVVKTTSYFIVGGARCCENHLIFLPKFPCGQSYMFDFYTIKIFTLLSNFQFLRSKWREMNLKYKILGAIVKFISFSEYVESKLKLIQPLMAP